MSVNVRIYKGMKKDRNSTAIPTANLNYTSYTDYSCELFEPCSITAPRIKLRIPVTESLAAANYAYISDFARYYWVTNAEYIDGLWIFSLTVDVLATYKTDIGNSYQYVTRSQTSYDGSITDTAYPLNGVTSQKWISSNTTPLPFTADISGGYFILGIVGQADTNVSRFGAVNYYMMTISQFNDFITKLMANTGDWLDYQNSDLKNSTVKMILNPMQYITSCMWFPFTTSPSGSALTSDIKFGWWTISGINHYKPHTSDGHPDDNSLFSFTIDSNTRHPQAARGSYLNREPYTNYKLYIPTCGFIEIPGRIVVNSGLITVAWRADLASGNMLLDIYGKPDAISTTEYPITRTIVKVGIDVPIAQIAIDQAGAVKSGVSTAASVIGGAASGFASGGIAGAILGGVTNLINGGIDTAIKATQPIANIMPGTGCIAPYKLEPKLLCEYQNIAGEANTLIGRPLCSYVQIKTLSGFILCSTNHIEIAGATEAELSEIEGYFTGGFRYE